jgi:3-hydroxyisobutyrate dehydrogenase-like beta-hydroxyacid dehydrogenase
VGRLSSPRLQSTPVTSIGFIGLGNMGKPMAANLIHAGFHLTVFDIRREAADDLIQQGAVWADSPRQVAERSSVVFTALPGPPEIEAAVLGRDGVLEGAQAVDYYIDVSTSTPGSIRTIAEQAHARGVQVLDAPVSGGVRGARKATLVFMVGGEAEAFRACEPILAHLGEKVIHTGQLGSGYVTKLVNNYMGMSNAVASMEAMVLGVRAGVDPQKLLEVVNAGTGASHMARTLYPYLILNRNFEPTRFSMELGAKDLQLAVDLAHELGVPVNVGETVAGALAGAVRAGMADKDFSTYITLLEQAAGVEVRA